MNIYVTIQEQSQVKKLIDRFPKNYHDNNVVNKQRLTILINYINRVIDSNDHDDYHIGLSKLVVKMSLELLLLDINDSDGCKDDYKSYINRIKSIFNVSD